MWAGAHFSLQYSGFPLQWLLLLWSTGSRYSGLSPLGLQVLVAHGVWNLPRPGIEPVSPVLAGGCLPTVPPGSPKLLLCVCLVTQSCPALWDPMDYSWPGSSIHGDSPGKNTRISYHPLLQGIFPTQRLNPGHPHCRWILYCLSHQGSPNLLL